MKIRLPARSACAKMPRNNHVDVVSEAFAGIGARRERSIATA
jgi:hypothetical protein